VKIKSITNVIKLKLCITMGDYPGQIEQVPAYMAPGM